MIKMVICKTCILAQYLCAHHFLLPIVFLEKYLQDRCGQVPKLDKAQMFGFWLLIYCKLNCTLERHIGLSALCSQFQGRMLLH